MYQFILLLHVFIAISLVSLVLVQQGKGATMGAAFGSGASQTVFGSRGSGSFLFRLTISLVVAFFVTSIALNYLGVHAYKQEKTISLPASMLHSSPKPAAAPSVPALPVPMPSTSSVAAPELPLSGKIPVRH